MAVNQWIACVSLVFCGSQWEYATAKAVEDYNSIKTCIVHHPVYCLHAANGDECYPDCSVVWQEQKLSVETIISCHSSTCNVIFKYTCLLLCGPTTESSSGQDSGKQEGENVAETSLLGVWRVSYAFWLCMRVGVLTQSIFVSLWICRSKINVLGSLGYCCFVLFRCI